jgi:hypothetical protein
LRGLGMGETAALSPAKGMRRGLGYPVNKVLKKQAREPWNERKGFMVSRVRVMPVQKWHPYPSG